MTLRRKFIGYSLAALIAGAPVLAAKASPLLYNKVSHLAMTIGLLSFASNPVFPATFGGNPNAVFTGSIGGSIAMSRTSGNCVPANATIGSPGVPAPVQVSASSIIASGDVISTNGTVLNISAYSDLEFSWNFGDPTGKEIILNPALASTANPNGLPVNANTGQTGPEASYVYRTAPSGGKTYTITLYARGMDGLGGFITGVFTSTFTAVDQTQSSGFKSWYVDSVNGNDAWDGTASQFVSGTIGPKATFYLSSPTVGVIGVMTNNSCIFVAGGSSFLDTGTFILPVPNHAGLFITNGVKLTSYVGQSGSTTTPALNISSTTTVSPIGIGNGSGGFGQGSAVSDVTISNINCTATNGTHGPLTILPQNSTDPSASMYDIYLDSCIFTQSINMTGGGGHNFWTPACHIYAPWAADSQRTGIWNCQFISPSVGATLAATGNSYVSATGVITLNTLTPMGALSVGQNVVLENLTGTGSLASIETASHPWPILTISGTSVTLQGPTGLGIVTITGGNATGNLNAQLSPLSGGWTFVTGGLAIGDSTDNSRGHNVYSHVGNHLLYKWFSTQPPGVNTTYGSDYSLNIEGDPNPSNLVSGVLGCGMTAKIPVAGSGAGASTTLQINNWKGPLPIAVGMMVQFNTINNPAQVTAALSTSIASFTYSAGVGTITVTAGHNVSPVANGIVSKIFVTVSGADAGYNGSYVASYLNSTQLTVSMANPGSASATVPGSYTGGNFTITPMANNTLPTYTGTLSMINLDALCQGNFTTSTHTFTITSGTELFGNGTTEIQVGDVVVFPGSVGSSPLLWAYIATITGTPVTSFTVTLPGGFPAFSNGTNITVYTLPAPLITEVQYTLIDGCMLATGQGGHSGNSSTNDASYLRYDDFVCQNSAFVNLQNYGAAGACLNTYTMRNCRAWGSTNVPVNGLWDVGLTGSMASTANWRCYGNYAYFGTAAEIFNAENHAFSSASIPLQLTGNKFWNAASGGALVGIALTTHANSLIDNNDYNAPASASFMRIASGTPVSYPTWIGEVISPNVVATLDQHSTNVNNATPTGPFAAWNLNGGLGPQQWSDFGP